jgi:protein-S-isoprenylcysteine O-methyltransferase Ste14
VLTCFAFIFARPRRPREWISFGAFSLFIVAHFTERYGFPLTLYLFSLWLGKGLHEIGASLDEDGNFWRLLFGWKGDSLLDPFYVAGNLLFFGGLILVSSAWRTLHRAQRSHGLAMAGPYAFLRHPQYVGFALMSFGLLLQWPALLNLIMFPILIWVYVRLANREEQELLIVFGDEYKRYAASTPAFLPKLRLSTRGTQSS